MKAVNGAKFQIQWDKTFSSATAFFNFSFGNFSGFSEMHFETQMEIMGFGNHNVASEQGRRKETMSSAVSSGHDSIMTHFSITCLDSINNCY